MTTPSIETATWLALQARVNTIPYAYAKAWPGQPFTVPAAGGLPTPFIRVGHVPAAPSRQLIANGKQHVRTGRLVLTLSYPIGQDISVYNEIAGKIAEHFKDGTSMRYGTVCITVRSYPEVQAGYEESGYWNVPIMVPWWSYQ